MINGNNLNKSGQLAPDDLSGCINQLDQTISHYCRQVINQLTRDNNNIATTNNNFTVINHNINMINTNITKNS